MTAALAALTKEEKEDECISHVIKLRLSWSEGNYVRFFKLYSTAPKMSGEDDKIHRSFNPNSGLGVNVLDVYFLCLKESGGHDFLSFPNSFGTFKRS